METHTYDIVIIGGGINGTGIARDAAGRGLRVLLCEKGDLGGATSSSSTKLIHGGLRYLEHGEFRLVREALQEREVLMNTAPHIIWPMQFILPHQPDMRPAWMIRVGLFLYDHLGRRKHLPGSGGIDLHTHTAGTMLEASYKKGFIYSDCWVQDARLVILNAMDAKQRGADIYPRTECISAERHANRWDITLRNHITQEARTVHTGILINATGPWAGKLPGKVIQSNTRQHLRLIKGSHIVVPRLFDHSYAYTLQQPDKRVAFAIPYERDFTLIGTTEEECATPEEACISREEIVYLCDAVGRYFQQKPTVEDVVWSYTGVRPLQDMEEVDASAISRDYQLQLEGGAGEPALLHVFGGKITTYRKLAEQAMEKLSPFLPNNKPAWTANIPLPGGDLPHANLSKFQEDMAKQYPWMPAQLLWRYSHNYGTLTEKVVGKAERCEDLGHDLGGGLFEAELEYLIQNEWARTPEDILWRRSKMGLHVPKGTESKLLVWLSGRINRV